MNYTLLFFFGCLIGWSCTTKKSEVQLPSTDEVKFARLFYLEKKNNYQELIIRNPKTLKDESKYILADSAVRLKIPPGYKRIDVPVKNMAVLSTSFVGMLSAIDRIDVIKATTEEQYISNPKLLREIQAGRVITAGYETSLSPESVLKAKIPLIMFSGFGQPFPNEEKYAQLGVVCFANYDWEEKHPLGKAEWIKVFGALVGKEKEASAYFDVVVNSYTKLKRKAKALRSKQHVMCGSLVGDVWYAPAGESFMAGIMKDGGLNYYYKNSKGTASFSPSFEQVFMDDQKCSIWINAEATSLKKLIALNAKFGHFHTVTSGKVYSYMHDPNYYWEYSPVNPHWLLEDFYQIASGDTQATLHFYKQLN